MDRLYLFFIGRIPGGTRCGAPPSGYKNETPGRGRVVQERKRLHFLILLVATVALIVCASAVYALYSLAHGAELARITSMVVAPEAQRRGIGRRLLREAEALARRTGIARIEVTSNARRGGAHAFYRGCGYSDDSARFVKLLGD